MKTIVVVAENHGLAQARCDLIQAVLRESYDDPVNVLPASSADYVLFLLGLQRIDVLLTDHDLSDMTGLNLIRWLGTGLADTTKILLTSDSRLLAQPEQLGVEIDMVLGRPIDREALRFTLHRWLGPCRPAPG